MEIRGHKVIKQKGEGAPHGGMIRVKGGFDKSEAEAARVAESFIESIDAGLKFLASPSPYAPDCPPIPGAPIETFDYFDAQTGEHVMLWRVACRANTTGPNRAIYVLKQQGAKPTIRALEFADLATGARYISTAQRAGASDEHFADYEAIREGDAVIVLPDGTTWAMCCGSARGAWAPSGWPGAEHIEDLAAEHAMSECAAGERMHEVYIDTALPDGTRCFCSECGPISLVPAPDASARVH
jgi:hypothetical protein